MTDLSPTPTPAEENRVAKIYMDPDTIRNLLTLPEGYKVERVWVEYDPMMIMILVSSPDLESQPPMSSAPMIEGSWASLVTWIDEGEEAEEEGLPWYRWGWSPTA